jgi:SAM-dependent methyltransferase
MTSCEVCKHRLQPRELRGGGVLAECPVCGHLERRLEDCPAAHRDRAYGGDPSLDKVRLTLTYRLLRKGTRPRRVFEMGFGTGALLRRFLEDGVEVSGADPDQLEVAVDARVRTEGRLWHGGVEELDPADHQVDLVYGVHVIEHVANVAATLKVAHSLLAPGGSLALLTPAGDSLGPVWFGAGWWLLEDPTHVRFFSADSIRRACEAVGFTDVRVRRLWLDNLTMEVASLVRLHLDRPVPPGGVLSSRKVLALGFLAAPLVVAVRALVPRLRPTLCVSARRSLE